MPSTSTPSKNEHARISSQQTQIEQRREALNRGLTEVSERIDLALQLMTNAQAVYANAPEHVKKLLNQAFYERILVRADGHIETENAEPFKTLRSRALQEGAIQHHAALGVQKAAAASGCRR
ncbi:hypothetical protein [Aeromicrobium sp. PE09-221]|uniref:hypothetical protein n=1 Tax=Aeromicrobium sp. PE09-221 TaxID=1898043 RepID=UPI001F423681|nr:hypothetical protein [Aeromicrobium sp. PE09-221]